MEQRVFNILFMAILVAMIGLGIIAPLMPIYARELGATGLGLGAIFSGFSLSRLVFMPIIGRLSDKNGRKVFITLGLGLYTLVSLFYPLARNVKELVLVRLFHGMASAMVIPIAMTYIGDIAPKGQEGTTMGTFTLALFLGMGTGPFLGGILTDKWGMKAAFEAMAALSAIAFLMVLFFLPDLKHHLKKGQRPWGLKLMLRHRLFKALLFFRAVMAMARGGLFVFLPLLAAKVGIIPSKIGILLSTSIFLTGGLQRPFGKLADRWHKPTMIILGTLISSLSLLLFPVSKSFIALLLLCMVMAVGGGMAMPAAAALMVGIGQEMGMGISMSLYNMAMSIGMMLSPLILGLIMDRFNIAAVFYFAGTLSLINTMIFYWLVK